MERQRHNRWTSKWTGALVWLSAGVFGALFFLPFFSGSARSALSGEHEPRENLFSVQSISTMKYSRDSSREALESPSFDRTIELHARLIAEAGATHMSIETPYDEEFLPVIRRWVDAARENGLSVWLRGNFSGWEGWFGYPRISREEHKEKLEKFLEGNSDLFADGDIFTPCPECENGGPGDPRETGDGAGYVDFLADERAISEQAFRKMGADVAVYPSMNGDIAREILTAENAPRTGDVVLIDHYTRTSAELPADIRAIAGDLDHPVGLGEFGAPIPDLNGEMTDEEQARFLEELLSGMHENAGNIPVVNYWTLAGGSTAILNDSDNTLRTAYKALARYYRAPYVTGQVLDPDDYPVADVRVGQVGTPFAAYTDERGYYQFFVISSSTTDLLYEKDGYASATGTLASTSAVVRLEPTERAPLRGLYAIGSFFHILALAAMIAIIALRRVITSRRD